MRVGYQAYMNSVILNNQPVTMDNTQKHQRSALQSMPLHLNPVAQHEPIKSVFTVKSIHVTVMRPGSS